MSESNSIPTSIANATPVNSDYPTPSVVHEKSDGSDTKIKDDIKEETEVPSSNEIKAPSTLEDPKLTDATTTIPNTAVPQPSQTSMHNGVATSSSHVDDRHDKGKSNEEKATSAVGEADMEIDTETEAEGDADADAEMESDNDKDDDIPIAEAARIHAKNKQKEKHDISIAEAARIHAKNKQKGEAEKKDIGKENHTHTSSIAAKAQSTANTHNLIAQASPLDKHTKKSTSTDHVNATNSIASSATTTTTTTTTKHLHLTPKPLPTSASSTQSTLKEHAKSDQKQGKIQEANEHENEATAFVVNPISEWEEPIEVPSLTLFDMHRHPRVVKTNPSVRIRLPLKVLTSEFQCPICLGYMKKTAIVMECLHRFCGECIQKCLRLGKKECPSCRIHIPTRRSLRPDPTFDTLIQKIYGDLEELEEKVEKEIERMNKLKNMNNAYSESRKRGIMQQARNRKKKQNTAKLQIEDSQTNNSQNDDGHAIQLSELEESKLVAFYLRKHPHETLVDRLEREYIRTSGEVDMKRLKMFLSRKLGYPFSSHFQILTLSEGKGVILDDIITLNDLKTLVRDTIDGDFFLYYRIFED